MILETQTDRIFVLRMFQDRISEDDFLWSRWKNALSLVGEYVGRIDGSNIEVKRMWMVGNALEPTMHIRVESTPSGGSIIRTRYTTSLFARVLYSFCLIGFSAAVIFAIAQGSGFHAIVDFSPLFVILIIALMRAFAALDERQLEQLVHSVAAMEPR